MKVSELIKRLEALKESNGGKDFNVVMEGETPMFITEAYFAALDDGEQMQNVIILAA